METKKIELTPFLLNLFMKHLETEQNIKNNMNRDLRILFESKGVEIPKEFSFEIKDGSLYYSAKDNA